MIVREDDIELMKDGELKRFLLGNDLVRRLVAERRLRHVISKGKPSANSFCIDDGRRDGMSEVEWKYRMLCDAFDLDDRNGNFKRWFAHAVSGKGHELANINRLGSSSMLALLCFAGAMLRGGGSFELELPGLGRQKVTGLDFEVENRLFDNPEKRPSSVDVFLETEGALVFLESKFTEFLDPIEPPYSYPGISGDYRPRYREIFGEEGAGDCIRWESGSKEEIVLRSNSCRYLVGIKQMVSHWMGLWHGGNRFGDRPLVLGEVMFNFRPQEWKLDDAANPLGNYAAGYRWLRGRLDSLEGGKSDIMMLPDVITYQDLFKDVPLPERVEAFYFPS